MVDPGNTYNSCPTGPVSGRTIATSTGPSGKQVESLLCYFFISIVIQVKILHNILTVCNTYNTHSTGSRPLSMTAPPETQHIGTVLHLTAAVG